MEAGSSDGQRIDMLVREYEICSSTAGRFQRAIWCVHSATSLASVAAFLITAGMRDLEVLVVGLIGLAVMSLSWIWYCIARRWSSIRNTLLVRMRHVEEDLNARGLPIYVCQYLQYQDGVRRHADDPFNHPILQIPDRRKTDLRELGGYRIRGLQFYGILVFLMNLAVWVLYVVYRMPLVESALFALRTNLYGR